MRASEVRLQGLTKSYGAAAAVRGISLDIPAGAMVSLVGPSGCGKTTTLRMIAGLEWPDQGQVWLGGRLLTDGRRGAPPEQRDLGMVFQSYALWPHMTVAGNVAFGLRRRRYPRAAIPAKVTEVLGIVGMARFAERYPSQLSGGQQQRVALARAIATEPGILLFDEPLSNLDAVLREEMRFEIRALQQRLGITGVYVTHSQDEALAISDLLAVMQDGVIVQAGPPMTIYQRPCNAFVAGFLGLANIVELAGTAAVGEGATGMLRDGSTLAAAYLPAGLRGRDAVQACIRPTDIHLSLPGGNPPANALTATIRATSFTGGLVDYFVMLPGGEAVRVQALSPLVAEPGTVVALHVPPEAVVLLEA